MLSDGIPSAITRAVERLRASGSHTVDDALLWLDASWRAAQREEISEKEFIRWMELGLWNLAGDPESLRKVGIYRMIGKERGWMLAQADLDADEALMQFYEKGADVMLEAAEVMLALNGLASTLPEEPQAAQPAPEEPNVSDHGPINFG
jgi:hypothetical protein